MRKNNAFLILLLLCALVLSFAAGLMLDPSTQTVAVPIGTYQVQISEICAKNETIIADNDGKYRDYIELYNAGTEINLSGCRLTDGSVSYRFDDFVLGAEEYRLLFLGQDTTGFAISASGRDSIQLQDPTGNIISQYKLQSIAEDQVMILENGVWQLSNSPSPGFSNDAAGIHAFRKGTPVESLQLRISEVLIANTMSLPDEQGVFSDVVELYNDSAETVQLGGWYLSDSVDQRLRYRLPDVSIPAGDYLLIYCDGENYVSGNHIHTNFGLTAQEELCLSDRDGNYATLRPQYSGDDISLSMTEDGYTTMASSLGYPNTEDGAVAAREARIDESASLVISEVLPQSSGVPYEGAFTDVVEIYNRGNETISTAGWYLSDGGDPYAYPLPEKKLAAGEYLVLPVNQQNAGFALGQDENLYLMGPSFLFSPVAPCGGTEDRSIALADGSYTMELPSIGFPNTTEGYRSFRNAAVPEGLQLSEAMSSNSTYLPGPYGNTTDWVELYNAGKKEIDLSAYCLTDSDDLYQYPLPQITLGAGKRLVIVLSETDKNLPQGFIHLPFSLSSSGDRLYLTRDGVIEDYLILPELVGDTAFGRPAGEGYTAQLVKPTPGEANSAETKISRTPTALQAQGVYNDISSLSIGFSGEGEIYYTTDCSDPDRSSKRYTAPVEITESTVFRVVAYEEGCTRSEILDLTYLLNEGDTLDTVCLVTDPDNLWSNYDGIYVNGTGAAASYPYFGANYWKDIEVPATVTLFDADGSQRFSESCGLKIFGGYSRAQKKKSFACMFRSKFGHSTLDYPLFGEEGLDSYQSFVLRAGGQDYYSAKFRDELITSLANEHLGIPVQQYRPVVLYLNGQYWGIYFIREKLTDQYVAGHYNAKAEDVALTLQEGRDNADYTALRSYARTHDLREKEHYDYIASHIDLDTYVDHVIIQMWIENNDLGNVKFFRIGEGKWTWVLFDTDVSMHNPARNTITTFLTPNQQHPHDQYARDFVNQLMVNEEFKDMFLRRMAYQLNTVWNEPVVTERIDYFCDLLKNDIAKECARWDHKLTDWENNVQILRTFAKTRTGYFLEDVQEYFGLTKAQMREYGFEV